MSQSIILHVTEEDILNAEDYSDNRKCIIALAAKRQLGDMFSDLWVGGTTVNDGNVTKYMFNLFGPMEYSEKKANPIPFNVELIPIPENNV
jgi:hypothetical protein